MHVRLPVSPLYLSICRLKDLDATVSHLQALHSHCLQEANELDCTKLQPFEGADVKWEKMVRAKDRAEAQASIGIRTRCQGLRGARGRWLAAHEGPVPPSAPCWLHASSSLPRCYGFLCLSSLDCDV